jgi:hypothetical protein
MPPQLAQRNDALDAGAEDKRESPVSDMANLTHHNVGRDDDQRARDDRAHGGIE